MKTLTFRSADASINVAIACDIFATNAELQEDGFDTRFTAMTIQGDTDAAIVAGVNINEMEFSYRAMIQKAIDLGLGLYVTDINEDGEEFAAVEPATEEVTE